MESHYNARVVWNCEVDKYASQVLALRYPGVPNLGDITQVQWDSVEPVDILTGGFPCFTAGAPVLTHRGMVPIEDVVVGDLVLTHRRRWRRVTATMSREAQTIDFLPGMTSTPDHPFYTRANGRAWDNEARKYRRSLGPAEFVPATGLKGRFVAVPTDIPMPPGVEVPALPGGMTWWLVGRYLADGYTTSKRAILGIGKKKFPVPELDGLPFSVERTSVKVRLPGALGTAEWLVQHFGKLSTGKTLPAWAFAMAAPDRAELLSGYLAGDGYRPKQGNSWIANTVSPTLYASLALLGNGLGYTPSYRFVETADTKVIEGRTVNQRDYWSIALTPDDGRFTQVEEGIRWIKVRRDPSPVTHATSVVYDLTVEEDHSFICWSFAVHNCQDVSGAGHRKGLRPGTRSGLWSHMAYAIEMLRPQRVVVENVRGLLSASAHSDVEPCEGCMDVATGKGKHPLRALGAVLGDLADLGYDAKWGSVRASDAGACHRRERVFVVATPQDPEQQQQSAGEAAT